MTYAQQHIAETIEIASKIDVGAIEKMADLLAQVKADGGRIFFLGVGGSAGNCGHAVNDFRKIVGIEAYAPTDNVSELTARTNDEGWATIFVEWLKVSKLQAEGRSRSSSPSAAAIWRRTSAPISLRRSNMRRASARRSRASSGATAAIRRRRRTRAASFRR